MIMNVLKKMVLKMLANNQIFDSIAVKCMTTKLAPTSLNIQNIHYLLIFFSLPISLFLLYIWYEKYFNTGKIEMKNIHTWQIIKFVATARFMCILNTYFKAWPLAFQFWTHLTNSSFELRLYNIIHINMNRKHNEFWFANSCYQYSLLFTRSVLFVWIFHLNFKLYLRNILNNSILKFEQHSLVRFLCINWHVLWKVNWYLFFGIVCLQ